MKKDYILIALIAALTLTSCGEYNKLLKSTDYEYKYEAAKGYFAKGQYTRAATLLNELIAIMKGTDKAEESVYMLGMCYYNMEDYQTAAQSFIQYYQVYPRGMYTELARYHAGKALFLDTPDPRLDQSSTYKAIEELQMFLEFYPQSTLTKDAQNMLLLCEEENEYGRKDVLQSRQLFGQQLPLMRYYRPKRPERLSLHQAARGHFHPDIARQVRAGRI